MIWPLVLLSYLPVLWFAYDWGFDQGWIHRHLGGRRRPWERNEPWQGQHLTAEQLRALSLDQPPPDDMGKIGNRGKPIA